MSGMPCSPTPGKWVLARPTANPMVTSAICSTSSFPLNLTGLNHFSLAAYGLPARCPTLNRKGYPHWSKDSLPGGWLALPGRASHPLELCDLARPHTELFLSRWLKIFSLIVFPFPNFQKAAEQEELIQSAVGLHSPAIAGRAAYHEPPGVIKKRRAGLGTSGVGW